MNYIEELKDAIIRLHGCQATYLETVPITETFQGEIVWQGDVEVFEITGHSQAKRCYSWAHDSGEKGKRFVAVLELPPINSARSAVQAAIVEEHKSKHGER